jgi:hypothetical protein
MLDNLVDYRLETDMERYFVVPQKDSEEKYRHYAVSNDFGILQSRHGMTNAIVQSEF